MFELIEVIDSNFRIKNYLPDGNNVDRRIRFTFSTRSS